MATKTVSTGWSDGTSNFGSIFSTSDGDKFYSMPISTVNTAIKNAGLPTNAVISGVSLTATATVSNSTIDGRYYLSIGYGGSGSISTAFFTGDPIAYDARSGSITRTVSLNAALSNNSINTSKGSHITFRIYSTTAGKKTYQIKDVNLTITYSIPTYTVTVTAGTGGTVSGGGTYEYGGSATIKATPNTGYKFVQWSDGNTSATRTISNITANATYTATFEKAKYTVNFKNQDGSVVKTNANVEHGTTLGTLPTVSRSGYTFAGWIPCEPAKKSDGSVLDSYKYNGDNTYPLDKKYKYTDKLSVHIEAYMSNWEDIASLKAQIISCTEGGGWGLGYQANSSGHGTELYAGGYKGIDLELGTAGKFSNNTWYSFDIVFSNGTFEAYVNGTKKGTQTTANTTISYHADNTIFVGAEAAKSATTPGGNYFKGYISNVFIANQGTRLVAATTSTVVEGDIDYYPVWRLNTGVNYIYVGTSQPKEIYVGTSPVKAIYVGTTKVYG